ncbi:hypothetical protein Pcinc_005203 [Petrolisthes cinctipes]|uniref:WAP domain-containing protein n=1 Tax=Petrolisthes cinctipes TaxID=88211 RepID=A0AAE1KZM0_PETCI|nr:hypothetical protein Pcinc_005203 [Petrolisthes cinctipes]
MGVGKVSVILAVLVALSVLTVVVSEANEAPGAGHAIGRCPPIWLVLLGQKCQYDYHCNSRTHKCCPSLLGGRRCARRRWGPV